MTALMGNLQGFAYAQARLQARYAELPAESDWQRLSASRTLSGYLEDARGGALRIWVKGFSAQSNCHDIERGIRGQFIDTVDQLARFAPGPWREAVRWCRWLPWLGLFDHLRAGGALPVWAKRAYRLADLFGEVGEVGGLDADAVRSAGIGSLLSSVSAAVGPTAARSIAMDGSGIWTGQWRRRWPACSRSGSIALESIVGLCATHLRAFRDAAPDAAWILRQQLRERLRFLFHLHLRQPVELFVFLALTALDLERLRRALLDRALFGDLPTTAAMDPDATRSAGDTVVRDAVNGSEGSSATGRPGQPV